MRTENDLKLKGVSDALEKIIEVDRKAWLEASRTDEIEHGFIQLRFEISCFKERAYELEQVLSNE